MNPETVLGVPSLVIVSPVGIFDEIQEMVLNYNKNSKVIDLSEFMAII